MLNKDNVKVGDRVQLHPATDLWMRGARYATILAVNDDGSAKIRLDRLSDRTLRIRLVDLLEVVK